MSVAPIEEVTPEYRHLSELIAELVREQRYIDALRRSVQFLTQKRNITTAEVNAFIREFSKAIEFAETGTMRKITVSAGACGTEDCDGGQTACGQVVDTVLRPKPVVTRYPVVEHPDGYRVCTCPVQESSLICSHTLYRIIDRNDPEMPI